jgi:hypothetical protein
LQNFTIALAGLLLLLLMVNEVKVCERTSSLLISAGGIISLVERKHNSQIAV